MKFGVALTTAASPVFKESEQKDYLLEASKICEAKGYESCALSTLRGQVSIWADDMHRGEKLKGHNLNKWAKHVLKRVQDLNEVFEEDEKLRKEEK